MKTLIYSAGELPAKAIRSLAEDLDWMTRAANSRLSSLPWLNAFLPAGWFGKTSPVSYQRTEEGILEPLSGRWQNAGMGGPTESLTLSFSESPSVVVESFLSDILEDEATVPPQCYLTNTACLGILRRDDNRGRKLSEPLRRALETAAIISPQK